MSERNFALLYADLFNRYVERTNGKAHLAEAILKLLGSTSEGSLLDLGAGNGSLTRLLAPRFEHVVTVERNAAFREQLETIPNATVTISAMEECEFSQSFDVVLASYSLTGVNSELIEPLISRIFEVLNPGGRFLICTHADHCAWDRYAEIVSQYLGMRRSGGTSHQMAQLAKGGGIGVIRASVLTDIWDQNLDDLYDTLAFFFVENVEKYSSNKPIFLPALTALAGSDVPGRVGLTVIEEVIDVLPDSRLRFT